MKYVLDTNAVSALMKGERSLLARLSKVARREVGMPQPVVAEIEYGIQRLERSKRKEALKARLELMKSEIQRVEWTDEVSDHFGRIKAALERRGERIEDFDAAVAAHALAHDSVLVTANLKQMVRVSGLQVEDWARPAQK